MCHITQLPTEFQKDIEQQRLQPFKNIRKCLWTKTPKTHNTHTHTRTAHKTSKLVKPLLKRETTPERKPPMIALPFFLPAAFSNFASAT